MADIERTAMVTAYAVAQPSMIGVLNGRLRGATAQMLRSAYALPRRVTDAVIASGDRELLLALASNESRTPAIRAAQLRLARLGGSELGGSGLGGPELGRALYKAERSEDSLSTIRAAVLAGADPTDPAWRVPGGLVAELLGASGGEVLLPALRAPFPELVTHALGTLGATLTLPLVLLSCRVVLAHGGRDSLCALAELIEREEELGHPGLATLLRRALADPDPAAVLAADPSSTDRVVHLVRRYPARLPAVGGAAMDWARVCAEHRRLPLSAEAIMTLNRLPGCPQELAVQGFRADPVATMADGKGPLPPSVLSGPDLDLDLDLGQDLDVDVVLGLVHALPERRLAQALEGGLAAGWLPVEWMLDRVRPAAVTLGCLPAAVDAGEGVRTAVRELIAPLGADPAAWLSLYRLVNRFTEPATALVAAATVAATAAGNSKAGRRNAARWPRPLGAAFPAREPEDARRIFQLLFEYAELEVQEALVPYLDARAVQHLLVYGHPAQRIRDLIATVHGPSAQLGRAAHRRLPVEVVEELLDLDDPEVNAKLYLYSPIAEEERGRILAGRGRRGGEAPIPVSPALLDALAKVKTPRRRGWLTAGHLSGDLQVLRATLGSCRLNTDIGRLRVLIRLWERQGPQAVEALLDEQEFPGRSTRHPLPARTHRTVRQALGAPDGLAVLRARLAAEEDPERLAALLLRKVGDRTTDDRVRHLAAEGAALPWPQLIRAHRSEPLSESLLTALAAVPDCPRELLLEALRAQPLPPRAQGAEWLPRALNGGRLTTADVLRHAHPAPAVLAFLTATDFNRLPAVPRWRAPRREAAELVRDWLGTDPEAWATALQLLPDFTGSLPELLTTTAAVLG
ncbi:hypothetical protein P3T36_007316 [Kitasatospora sp. MAP12-15]|uniref:hypothetical protein n=1 Tax=unclassified Kitasatospora TaxID=2633591 RepID=UPI002474D115|nr:hypothetical protein [Kitasatospora sp. MAP12-44]MDH6115027.1 hypothetical protein [Kitasatospora sp. MAP12-44]